MRKTIALVLSVLMIATILPVGIFAADEKQVGKVNLRFDFEGDTSWANTYFNNHKGASPVTFEGSKESSKNGVTTFYWGKYVTEEDGNTYSYCDKSAGNGYAIRNESGYDNFGDYVRLSFRAKFNSLSNTNTTNLYFPIVRLSGSGNAFGGTSGFANLIALGTGKSGTDLGEAAKTDGTKNFIGYLYAGSGGGTNFNNGGLRAYSDTWYEFDAIFDKTTGKYWLVITDGVTSYTATGTNSALKGLDILNQIVLFRGNGGNAVAVGFDDLHLTNELANFGALGTDMSTLQYSSNEGATHASSSPNFIGFGAEGSANASWNLVSEGEDGATNQYISHIEGAADKPLTFNDNLDLLDQGAFSYSFDFRHDGGTQAGGLLSVKVSDMSKVGEFRIINFDGVGNMFFGPVMGVEQFKIASIVTGDWYTIKTVFKPYVTEDYVDMCYDFYINEELFAYTEVVNGSYNFYTKASGVWTAVTDLQPAKAVEYMDGDTVSYKWVGEDKSIGANCSWGNDSNNINRLPMGYWDGYTVVGVDGNETVADRDGKLANIASIYMFHFIKAGFSLDNLEVELLGDEVSAYENVEVVGYQLGTDGTSVRFIACVDSLDYGQVGMDIDVFTPEADMASASTLEPLWTTKVNNKMSNDIFIAITADGESVGAREAFGARYFTMLSVYGIDSNAVIRINPYTTKNGVRFYGEPAVYTVSFDRDLVTVIPAEEVTADYSNGFKTSGANNGYCYNAWSSYTWDTLAVNPMADIGWGGESGDRVATLLADGSIRLDSDLYFKLANKIQETVTSLDEATGEEVTTKVDVKDNDGNQLYSAANYSRRIKFAGIIPTNLEDYIGSTFVVTAKVRATEINTITKEDVVVGEGENAKTYNVALDKADPDGQCGIAFGIMTDYKTSMVASNSYVIKNDGEWVDVQVALEITEGLLKNAAVAPVEKDLAPVTDADGVVHPAPLRPTINLSDSVDGGYAREFYVKDLTLTIIPSVG